MSVGSRGSIKVVSFKLWSMKNICERSFKLNIFCKIKFTKHVMNAVHFWRCSINKFLKEWDEMKNIKQMGKDYIIYIWLHLQASSLYIYVTFVEETYQFLCLENFLIFIHIGKELTDLAPSVKFHLPVSWQFLCVVRKVIQKTYQISIMLIPNKKQVKWKYQI